MKERYIIAAVLLLCLGCQPTTQKANMPPSKSPISTQTNVVLKVGVAPDGMLKQQVVHAYKTRELAQHKLVVHAGASLVVLESEGTASRVHFASKAWTPDYKTEIAQADAVGWIATEEIVLVKTNTEAQ